MKFDRFLKYLNENGISFAQDGKMEHRFCLYRLKSKHYPFLTSLLTLSPSFIVDVYGIIEDRGDGIGIELWDNADKRARKTINMYKENSNGDLIISYHKRDRTRGLLKNGNVALKPH